MLWTPSQRCHQPAVQTEQNELPRGVGHQPLHYRTRHDLLPARPTGVPHRRWTQEEPLNQKSLRHVTDVETIPRTDRPPRTRRLRQQLHQKKDLQRDPPKNMGQKRHHQRGQAATNRTRGTQLKKSAQSQHIQGPTPDPTQCQLSDARPV